jgi:hypothetical protein
VSQVVTVRDLVAEMQREIRDTSLTPDRACVLLARLSSLIGNCNDEIREADMEFNVVLLKYLDADEAANRAKIRAETSPEYARKREARDTLALVDSLVGSLKYILRAMEAEMKFTR